MVKLSTIGCSAVNMCGQTIQYFFRIYIHFVNKMKHFEVSICQFLNTSTTRSFDILSFSRSISP